MARLRMALATSKDHQESEPNFSPCLPNISYYIMAVCLGRINFKSPPLLTFPQTRKGMTSAITTYQWIQPKVESFWLCLLTWTDLGVHRKRADAPRKREQSKLSLCVHIPGSVLNPSELINSALVALVQAPLRAR